MHTIFVISTISSSLANIAKHSQNRISHVVELCKLCNSVAQYLGKIFATIFNCLYFLDRSVADLFSRNKLLSGQKLLLLRVNRRVKKRGCFSWFFYLTVATVLYIKIKTGLFHSLHHKLLRFYLLDNRILQRHFNCARKGNQDGCVGMFFNLSTHVWTHKVVCVQSPST